MGFRSWYLQIISPVSPLTAFGLCVYKHCEHFFPLAASMGLPSYRFVCFPLLTQIIWRGFHTNIYQLFHVISTQTQGHFCICCGCEESTTKELKGSHSDSGLWLCWKASPTTGQALVTIATFKAELYIFLSCLAISVFHSSTALWWIPSGLSNLLQFNFSICSITSFLIFLSGKKKKNCSRPGPCHLHERTADPETGREQRPVVSLLPGMEQGPEYRPGLLLLQNGMT